MADATLGTAVLRTRLDASGLKTGLSQAKGETQKFTADTSTAIRGIGAAFGAVVASQGVRSYISFLTSSANLAHQADSANRLFEKSLQRTNQSLSEGAGLVQRLSGRFGVANSVIESSATLLLRQGASLDDIERALTAAAASAAAAGFDISTAFDNVATAVATGRSELLETSGIVTNLGPVTQAYAKSIGKTVEQLTEQEVIQARVNAIYAETRSEIEDVDDILQGLPRSQANWTKEVRTFREDAGEMVQQVLVPLIDAGTGFVGLVNDLPEPVKRAGIAMSGAAIGATGLATGINAIKVALPALRAVGLASFGPAGWIVLGVTAVAGLAAALSGRPDSLDKAIEKANQAIAGGDKDTLTGALDEVIAQTEGPVKTAFLELQDEIRETGEITVETVQQMGRALSLMDEIRAAQARVFEAEGNLARTRAAEGAISGSGTFATQGVQLGAEPLLRAIQQSLNVPGLAQFAAAIQFDAETRRFELDAERTPAGEVPQQVINALADANAQFAGASENLVSAVSSAEEELASANAALEAVLAKIFAPSEGAAGGGGGGGGTINVGAGGPAGTPTDPVVVSLAGPPITLPDDPTRLPPPGLGRFPEDPNAQALADAERRARREGLQTELEINADLRAQAQAIRQDTQQAIADRQAENVAFNETLGQLSQQLTARDERGDGGLVRQGLMTQLRINADLQAQAAAIRADTQQAQADRRAEQRAFGDRAGALSLQLGARAARGDGGLSILQADRRSIDDIQDELNAARDAVRAAATDEARHEAQLVVQELERELARVMGRITARPLQVEFVAALKPLTADQAAFGDRAGALSLQLGARAARGDGGLSEVPGILRTAADEQRQAAVDFAGIIVGAGKDFTGVIRAFQTGDIGAGIGGLAGIGASIASLIPGGSLIAPLITGIGGLVGGLFGLFNGGRDDSAARAAAEQRRVGNVPSINLNFSVQQTNTYNGAPSDPQNEQAFRRQADAMFESIYRRHLGPRLDRIEQRLGIAGAA